MSRNIINYNEMKNKQISHCRDSSKIQQKDRRIGKTDTLNTQIMTTHFPGLLQVLQ